MMYPIYFQTRKYVTNLYLHGTEVARSFAAFGGSCAPAEIQLSQMVESHFAMRSSSKNDGQDFLTLVAALTTASMGVSPPWIPRGWSLTCTKSLLQTRIHKAASENCLSLTFSTDHQKVPHEKSTMGLLGIKVWVATSADPRA